MIHLIPYDFYTVADVDVCGNQMVVILEEEVK